AVLVAVAGTLLGAPILDPIIGLVITATILVILKSASISIIRRLLDGIEPEILDQVEHAPLHVDGVREVQRARARWVGHRVYADLDVVVDQGLTIEEGATIAVKVKAALATHVPAFGGAVVAVVPYPWEAGSPAH
ncbi:MAG: cation transporter dimerization domain-containing protein, partial [Rhodoglobus sp.]|nr:cation transporter dimerization domain-containing protein [Rhodoglobus sp.]